MYQHDIGTLRDNGIATHLRLDEGHTNQFVFMRVEQTGESFIRAESSFGTATLVIPDDFLDAFVEAVQRLKELRARAAGDRVVKSLRGTKDGIALAEALERRVA